MPTPFVWPDVNTAVRAKLSPGPARAAVNHAGGDRVREALAVIFEAFRGREGRVDLDNVFRVVIARA